MVADIARGVAPYLSLRNWPTLRITGGTLMHGWKMHIAWIEADRRRAEAERVLDEQRPPAIDSPEPGAPWFDDCEPYPRAT
jgi:hypothetical protein